MENLITGQVVWIGFAVGNSTLDGRPHANVSRGVVLDGENRIVKRDSGYVSVCGRSSVEQCYASEAEAWAANAGLLERFVAEIEEKARECRSQAAKAAVEVAA